MNTTHARIDKQTNNQQIQRVLGLTLALNLLVAFGKLGVGIVSGSLAIAADGLHSLIDASSNVVALVANRLAGRPADDDHPYGHGRYETLGALLLGGFLLLVAWEILTGALERLQSGDVPTLTPVTFIVLAATLVVNIGVSRYQRREGRRLRSDLLLADAANTGADVYVTLSVLASAVVISLTGWYWIDTLAALFIVVLIGRAALKVVQHNVRVLVDTAPYEPDFLRGLLVDIPGIEHISRIRSRGTIGAAHIDVDVQVAPAMTASQTAAIARSIRTSLADNLDGLSEVEVHFAPQQRTVSDYTLTTRAHADALGLGTHDVRVRTTGAGQRRVLEMHVEVSPTLTLRAAHKQVSRLERELVAALPEINDVITHIEPAEQVVRSGTGGRAVCDSVEAQALSLLQTAYPQVDWHEVCVHPQAQGYALSIHATLAGQMHLVDAHRIAEQAETLLKATVPGLDRVIIHTEPSE